MSVLLLLGVLLGGCSGKAVMTKGQEDEARAKAMTGQYTGVLPCADCDGLALELTLKPDHTFTQEVVYRGGSDIPFTSLGTYSFLNDSILVTERGTREVDQYLIVPQGLLKLDLKGMRITDLPEEDLLLRKVVIREQSAPRPSRTANLLTMKMLSDIRFYAMGQEPSWTLDVTAQGTLQFRSATEVKEINSSRYTVEGDPGGVLRYTADHEGGGITAIISAVECADISSGERFPYTVQVLVTRGVKGMETGFSGCGRYVPDRDLQGTWVLQEMNGDSAANLDMPEGAPRLIFRPGEESVTGSDGCNSIVGGFRTVKDGLRFGALATTEMWCEGEGVMEASRAFVQAISDREMRCTITGDRLELSSADRSTLGFRKVR